MGKGWKRRQNGIDSVNQMNQNSQTGNKKGFNRYCCFGYIFLFLWLNQFVSFKLLRKEDAKDVHGAVLRQIFDRQDFTEIYNRTDRNNSWPKEKGRVVG